MQSKRVELRSECPSTLPSKVQSLRIYSTAWSCMAGHLVLQRIPLGTSTRQGLQFSHPVIRADGSIGLFCTANPISSLLLFSAFWFPIEKKKKPSMINLVKRLILWLVPVAKELIFLTNPELWVVTASAWVKLAPASSPGRRSEDVIFPTESITTHVPWPLGFGEGDSQSASSFKLPTSQIPDSDTGSLQMSSVETRLHCKVLY